MPRHFDLRINQGETWRCVVPVLTRTGAPHDLIGITVRGQIRAARTSGTALHTWSANEENVDLDAGQITLHVPATVSSDWSWTFGLWDLEIADPSGVTARLLEGAVWVTPEITRG